MLACEPRDRLSRGHTMRGRIPGFGPCRERPVRRTNGWLARQSGRCAPSQPIGPAGITPSGKAWRQGTAQRDQRERQISRQRRLAPAVQQLWQVLHRTERRCLGCSLGKRAFVPELTKSPRSTDR